MREAIIGAALAIGEVSLFHDSTHLTSNRPMKNLSLTSGYIHYVFHMWYIVEILCLDRFLRM